MIILKLLLKILRRFLFSAVILYFINLVIIQYKFVIPINLYSLSIVSTLGCFGLIGLIVFRLLL